jgi:molecular chaperone IbpA
MATLDYSPLFRSSVGYDRLPALFNEAMGRPETTFPPYNIETCGEDRYRIVLALAGFNKDDVEVVVEHKKLLVRGRSSDGNGATYLHRGIATRSFERQFDLAEFIEVTGATIGDGLLVIDLKREVPESLKPRSIPIGTGAFVRLCTKSSKPTHQQTA